MTPVISILALLLGLCVGGGYALRVRSIAAAQHQQLAEAAAAAARRESTLQVELARAQSLTATGDQMLDAFRAVSADALATQSQQFLQLAETKYGTLQQSTDTVVSAHSQAVGDGLARLGERLTSLEKERSSSTVELRTMVAELSLATAATKAEAAKLAAAMSDNRVRGAWGEVQLRRALELAGLSRHVDFAEQSGVTDGAASGRPDVVVHLPNGHDVVIDSKVPLDRYLQAVDANDPAAEHELQVEHANAVARHAKDLAGRNYARLLESSIDLVLMFLPGESFLAAALDADPTLFESAAAKGVYLVTPSSLVPLLRGIALGWRERQAEQAAVEIHQLGIELHDRIGLFADHYTKVGTQLERTVAAYNTSMGSFETRLATTARKLSERGAASSRESGQPAEIETRPRELRTLTSLPPEGTPSAPPLPDGAPAAPRPPDRAPEAPVELSAAADELGT